MTRRSVLHIPLAGLLVALAMVAPIGGPSPAAAAPPDDKPLLFVVRGTAEVSGDRIRIESARVEWFTDRPDRRAGSMRPTELAKRWGDFGFDDAAPNAAITGSDDLDVVVELDSPRARGKAISFRAEGIRGTLPSEELGTVSLFIDATTTKQWVSCPTTDIASDETFAVDDPAAVTFQGLSLSVYADLDPSAGQVPWFCSDAQGVLAAAASQTALFVKGYFSCCPKFGPDTFGVSLCSDDGVAGQYGECDWTPDPQWFEVKVMSTVTDQEIAYYCNELLTVDGPLPNDGVNTPVNISGHLNCDTGYSFSHQSFMQFSVTWSTEPSQLPRS